MDIMFDNYESQLLLEEARCTIAESDWSYVDRYVRWFFRVSHPYMVEAALGDPPVPGHQKLLEEDHT